MPTPEFEMPNENVTAAEFKLKDPDGNALDVSEKRMGSLKAPRFTFYRSG
jgi:hypothetical protein